MIPIRKKKIGRNELCPCGSNKKYKHCHGGSNAVPTPNPGQLDAQLRKLVPNKTCLAPDTLHEKCQGRIIASHTVSRSGSLGEIAKDGCVYSYATSIQQLNEMGGRLQPKLTGWKAASTFPGFCSHHDKKLFAPLEDKPFMGSQQQCFLLSYRSNAWEYYAKLRADHHSRFRVALAASKNPAAQAIVAMFNRQNELGLRDTEVRKKNFDDALTNHNWSVLQGLLIEFDRIFPIQCSAAWSPTIDVFGKTIQVLDHTLRTPEGATIVSFSANGKSYFLLSWLSDNVAVASKVADSIAKIPKSDVAGVIAALLLLTSENCHLSPNWYDALSKPEKDFVNDLAHPVPPTGVTPVTAGANIRIGCIGITSILRF